MVLCPGISWSLSLNPGIFYTLFVTLFKAMDFALDSFILWVLYAGIPPFIQAVLWLVGVVLVICGELPTLRVMLQNWKTRLRRRYFDICHWLFPKLYPRKHRKKYIWRQLRSFRRWRLALRAVLSSMDTRAGDTHFWRFRRLISKLSPNMASELEDTGQQKLICSFEVGRKVSILSFFLTCLFYLKNNLSAFEWLYF